MLDQLLATADVFLTNLRPGALARLASKLDTVRERYPPLCTTPATASAYAALTRTSRDTTRRRSSHGADSRTCSRRRTRLPDQSTTGAMGDRNGAMALTFGSPERTVAARARGSRFRRRRVVARHGDVDALVRCARGTAGRRAEPRQPVA